MAYLCMADRQNDGITVRLLWQRDELTREDEFQVTYEDKKTETAFVLYPDTGAQALHAYYHPNSAAREALASGRLAGNLG